MSMANSQDLSLEKKNVKQIKLDPLDHPPRLSNEKLSHRHDEDNILKQQTFEKSQFQQKSQKQGNIRIDNEDDVSKTDPNTQRSTIKNHSLIKKKKLSPIRLKIKKFMANHLVTNFIILLIILYVILIFSNIAMSDLMTEQQLESISWLLYIELSILSLFTVEISLISYGQGFKTYFKDTWLLFDGIVIIISMALVILDLSASFGQMFSSISSIVRGIFRFLRIFLLIRKAQSVKKIKTSSNITTPSEKIVDMLREFHDLFEAQEILQDIEWSIDIINTNKLYEPVRGVGNEDNQEWLEYGAGKDQNEEQGIVRKDQKVQGNKQGKKEGLKINPLNDKVLAVIPQKVLQMFQNIDELSFDCWELKQITKGQELKYLMIYLFQFNHIFTELQINNQTFTNFINTIQESYRNNPYHNCLHAFDVTQTVNFFFKKLEFANKAQLSHLELCSGYVAAACHDVDHRGMNNQFEINAQTELAIIYNDISVLENHHVSFSFNVLNNKEGCNFTEKWKLEDYKKFRELITTMILSTDMTKHFPDISKLKQRVSSPEFDMKEKSDKNMCLDSIIHASDISNPIKTWNPCFNWTNKVMEEFWNQGDEERKLGLPISYLCDKYTTNMAKSQGGFIDFVVKPLFDVIVVYLPDLATYIPNFLDNKNRWNQLITVYDEKLKVLNDTKDTQIN